MLLCLLGRKNTRIAEPMYQPGDWAWSLEHQQVCRVVETQDLWGDTLYRVWIPAKDAIVRVRDRHDGVSCGS